MRWLELSHMWSVLSGPFWDFMANFDINKAGFGIAGLFAATWIVALLLWRYGNVEARWQAGIRSNRAATTASELAENSG